MQSPFVIERTALEHLVVSLVAAFLLGSVILWDNEVLSLSSGKRVHRIVARRR